MSDNVVYPECFQPQNAGEKAPPSPRLTEPEILRKHIIIALLRHRPYWSERRIIEAAAEFESYIREGGK